MDPRKNILFAGKLTLTLGALYWLFTRSDFSAALAALHGGGIGFVAAAVLAHLAAFGIGCYRWWLYLRHTEPRIHFRDVFPAYLLGLFFNNVLPSNFGGDVVRVVRLGVGGLRVRPLIGSVLFDRVLGLAVILTLSILCLFAASNINLGSGIRPALVILVLAMAVVAGAIMTRQAAWLILKLYRKHRHAKMKGPVLDALRLCRSYLVNPRLLAAGIALSIVVQSLFVVAYYLLARGLEMNIGLLTFFAIVPIVFVISSLPVSVGGHGVREGALVTLLAASGVRFEAAAALSLLYLLVYLVSTTPGGFIELHRHLAPSHAEA